MAGNVEDAMRKYGIQKKNEVMWDFFGAIVLFIGLFAVGFMCKSRFIIRFSMFITFFLILALLLISVIGMILLVCSLFLLFLMFLDGNW